MSGQPQHQIMDEIAASCVPPDILSPEELSELLQQHVQGQGQDSELFDIDMLQQFDDQQQQQNVPQLSNSSGFNAEFSTNSQCLTSDANGKDTSTSQPIDPSVSQITTNCILMNDPNGQQIVLIPIQQKPDGTTVFQVCSLVPMDPSTLIIQLPIQEPSVGTRGPSNDNEAGFGFETSPLETLEDVHNIENQLQDPNTKTQVMTLLKRRVTQQSGKNHSDHVRRGMTSLLGRRLAAEYSWAGRIRRGIGKLPFRKLRLCSVIIDAMLNHYDGKINKLNVEEEIKKWLKKEGSAAKKSAAA